MLETNHQTLQNQNNDLKKEIVKYQSALDEATNNNTNYEEIINHQNEKIKELEESYYNLLLKNQQLENDRQNSSPRNSAGNAAGKNVNYEEFINQQKKIKKLEEGFNNLLLQNQKP
ncbi:hypothetical protein C1645_815857 [Glomus cerebriforme]|uniref:Uncharacterized protein n=1 Tax=Glomus cerebriforme TaxID=658196 RepID=A0A397TCY0_9GLOM|nr:hypothetical protein C1645_815857 [Glomus cerebriforme]